MKVKSHQVRIITRMSPSPRYSDDSKELKDLIDRVDMRSLYELVTSKSANGKRTAKGPMVHCPALGCSDKNPSAVIWVNDKAIKLFDTCRFANGKSFGGVLDLIMIAGKANNRGDAVDFLKKSGLGGIQYDASLSAPVRGVSRSGGGRGNRDPIYDFEWTHTANYNDATGATLQYQVKRWDAYGLPASADPVARKKSKKKGFSQFHPDQGQGEYCKVCFEYRKDLDDYADPKYREHPKLMAPRHPGKLEKGTMGIPRIPYQLHDVLEAAANHYPIFYVEGERKVDALRSLGIYATTNMGGAENGLPAEWAQYFQGASKLVFIPDCDKPGRAAAWERIKLFKKLGIPTMFLDIRPGFIGKYDIYDWYLERQSGGREAMISEMQSLYRSALEMEKVGRVLVIGDDVESASTCASYKDAIELVKAQPFDAIEIRTKGPAKDLKDLLDAAAGEGVARLETSDEAAQRYFMGKRRLATVAL